MEEIRTIYSYSVEELEEQLEILLADYNLLEGWTTSDGWVVYYVPGKKMKDRAYNTCWLVEDLIDSAGLLDQDRYIQDY